MSILVDKNTRVMRQGITGHQTGFSVESARGIAPAAHAAVSMSRGRGLRKFFRRVTRAH
ncbi:MAG: hypothetical protein OD918_00740 [Gammaproteobacteria bacterium]